jgi:hypothetical protein
VRLRPWSRATCRLGRQGARSVGRVSRTYIHTPTNTHTEGRVSTHGNGNLKSEHRWKFTRGKSEYTRRIKRGKMKEEERTPYFRRNRIREFDSISKTTLQAPRGANPLVDPESLEPNKSSGRRPAEPQGESSRFEGGSACGGVVDGRGFETEVVAEVGGWREVVVEGEGESG